jgi:hypothetical protein
MSYSIVLDIWYVLHDVDFCLICVSVGTLMPENINPTGHDVFNIKTLRSTIFSASIHGHHKIKKVTSANDNLVVNIEKNKIGKRYFQNEV